MVDLVHHQQRAVAAELGQMQVRGGGDGLVGGDVALQATAGVGGVLGGAHRQAMTKRLAPGGICEGLLGLQAQAVARHDPADALHHAGRDEAGGGNHRQEALAAARCHRGEDVAQALRLVGGNGGNDAGDAALMRAEGSGHANQLKRMASRRESFGRGILAGK
jgi:hypothetical protein